LNLSQPALSAQLRKLRDMFDDPLLVPADSGRGMVPTARAIELAAPLHDALHTLRSLVESRTPFDPGTAQRVFRIAANDNAVVVIGLPLMQRIAAFANPHLQVAFVRPDANLVAGQLEQGAVDLVIGSERMVPPIARARKLFDEHFLMVQRRNHPRGRGPLDLDAYCALRHVLVSTGGGSFHGLMDEHLQRLGRRRDVVASIEQFLLVPALLESSRSPDCAVGRYHDHPCARQLTSTFAGWLMASRSPRRSRWPEWRPAPAWRAPPPVLAGRRCRRTVRCASGRG
jgi:DNA-binding transcriptional LysR family regulator